MSVSLKKKKLFDYPIIFDHKPVVQAILNHLPLISCLSLLRTYPINISSIDLATQRVREYLLLYTKSEPMSVVFSTVNGCSLTGGFILSVLVGDPWWIAENYISDVDIACSEAAMHIIRQVIDAKRITRTSDYTGCECITDIYNFRLKKNNNRIFQIIAISSSVDEYIETFDLSVCMNYFTGDKLVIKDPESILKRVLVSTKPPTEKRQERIEKYTRRGFK